MNNQTKTDTPETDKHTGLRFVACELIATARRIERERDEAREKLRDLIEEEKTLRYELRILSKNAAEKQIEVADRLDRALAERDEARERLTLEEIQQGICDWEQTEDGQWLTDCGNVFEFTDGRPIYNDFICCPYCRKNLTETPYEDDGDSDYTP